MKHERARISHLVRVARLRIETAVIEIEGNDLDDEEAERQATEDAEFLPDELWALQPFNGNDYQPHVQSIVSREEIAELAQQGRSSSEELIEASESIRYQLLKGNCDTSEGELVLQPWLVVDELDLHSSDLCHDWISELKALGLTHLSERLNDLAAGSPPLPSDRILFNVKRRSEPKL